MSQPMDHDTCSRLLHSYLEGEAGEAAPAIADHLARCEQCRAERAALEILLAPAALTPAERVRLHEAVRDATFGQRESPLAAAPERERPRARSWRATDQGASRQPATRWLAPVLSAAAALLLIAGGVALFGHPGVGSSGNSTASADRVKAPGGQGGAEAVPAEGGGGPSFLPGPLDSLGEVARRAASRSKGLSAFGGAGGSQSPAANLLVQLAEDAPPELRGQVRLCGFRVLSDHSSFLPKAGALAIVEKQRALVLVFSVPEAPGTFDLNAWPVGTCGRQLAHRSVTTTP